VSIYLFAGFHFYSFVYCCYNSSILDVADNILDIDALTDEQEQVLNSISVEYGMRGMDYSEYVTTHTHFLEVFKNFCCNFS